MTRVRFSDGSSKYSKGQLQPSQSGTIVAVVVISVVVSIELDTEHVEIGLIEELTAFEEDIVGESFIEDDGATETDNMQLEDFDEEDDDELEETVAVYIRLTIGSSVKGSKNSTSFVTTLLVEDSYVRSMSIFTSCPPTK